MALALHCTCAGSALEAIDRVACEGLSTRQVVSVSSRGELTSKLFGEGA